MCGVGFMKKFLLCTVVFPQNEPYLEPFFDSVFNQSSDQFDFLIINENVDLRPYKIIPSRTIIEHDFGTPLENRLKTIKYAQEHGYDYVLWQDSDDICFKDRIATIVAECQKNEKTDIIVHDMSIIDSLGDLVQDFFVGKRFINRQIVFDDIKYFNFIGFGNMAVRVSALPKKFFIPTSVKIVDWWITSCLLLKGAAVKFLNKTLSAYRQYNRNMAALNISNKETFMKQLDLLLNHYQNLLEENIDIKSYRSELEKHFNKINMVRNNFSDNEELAKEIEALLTRNNNTNFLWWEKTNRIIREIELDG